MYHEPKNEFKWFSGKQPEDTIQFFCYVIAAVIVGSIYLAIFNFFGISL